MAEAEEVNRGKRFPLLPLLIVLALLGVAFFGEKGIVRVIKSSQYRSELVGQIATLQAANQTLRDEIEALHSDQRYLERIARKELGMVKADELVYQFRSHPAPKPIQVQPP